MGVVCFGLCTLRVSLIGPLVQSKSPILCSGCSEPSRSCSFASESKNRKKDSLNGNANSAGKSSLILKMYDVPYGLKMFVCRLKFLGTGKKAEVCFSAFG